MGVKLLGMETVKVHCGSLTSLYLSYSCWKNRSNIPSSDEGESPLALSARVRKDKAWEVEEERECLQLPDINPNAEVK